MKTNSPLLLTVLLLVTLLATSCRKTPSTPAYLDTRLTFAERVDDLVARLNLRQKVDQLRYDAPAIDSLHVPAHNWWNECLHGVARDGFATIYPEPIGLAATWDEQLIYRVADIISSEARVKHHAHARRGEHNIYQGLSFFAPNINIFRDPRWGRGMETYGEDPYLSGALAVQFIRGLQGDHSRYLKTLAVVKHFAVHSGPESTRHAFDVHPSTYDLLDTYLPHFERAVKEGGARGVMCAYQRLDGLPCCGSTFLEGILRGEWGFDGYIVSDCWAIHDFYRTGRHGVDTSRVSAVARALLAGTDQNCGDTYPALVEAVEQGLVTEADVDRSVKRLMRARMELGQFDPEENNPYARSAITQGPEVKSPGSLEASRASLVLLKNEGSLLPLDPKVKIAIIGPNATNPDVLLGNYNGLEGHTKTLLDYFQGLYRDRPSDYAYAPGCRLADGVPLLEPIPGKALLADSTGETRGLHYELFDNDTLGGEPVRTGIIEHADLSAGNIEELTEYASGRFSIRFTGYLVPPVTGDYALGGHAYPHFTLYLDDERVAGWRTGHETLPVHATRRLEAGHRHAIRFEYTNDNRESLFARLLWERPGRDLKQEALDAVRDADVVLLCMGLSPRLEGEEMPVRVEGFHGGDRVSLELPHGQQELIRAIHATGKPTVLVLYNGGALAINWEAQNIPAIVEAWYPGSNGSEAIAGLLFGTYSPSGRLPVTFYKSVNDLPPFDNYDMTGRTYRYFTGEPLFPFGHGLSYARFTYANLQAPDSVAAGDSLHVAVEVTNAGTRDAHEVVQLYVKRENAPGRVPLRSLQGFSRVWLKAGETRSVEFTLSPRQLGRVAEDHWVTDAGSIRLSVGGGQPTKALLEVGAAIERRIEIIE
ncbi:MAG: glycoside hydrolase family 3 C-terminal domain-containing protein [Odoribacteraceae bacterium]|jgi:beta-glucosidase|nr:glycoside hydrolase family 3 C-terminal domain-containing protein [Odoribacteraceae bacterium]